MNRRSSLSASFQSSEIQAPGTDVAFVHTSSPAITTDLETADVWRQYLGCQGAISTVVVDVDAEELAGTMYWPLRTHWVHMPAVLVARQPAEAPPSRSKSEARFKELVTHWRLERDNFSSGIENFIHPAYQQIIGLGPEALPLILRELEHDGDHWFWALRAITGENPIPDSALGDTEAMSKAWIDWARSRGITW